jgi:hypothetical protein
MERSSELRELARSLAKDLEMKLDNRFSEFGKDGPVIEAPAIPEDLTKEHCDAVREALGGGRGFEERILPSLASLGGLDQGYVDVMYPTTKRTADVGKGLVSYRPSWWGQKAEISGHEFSGTWGDAYVQSMRRELETLGGSLVLLDTATKPKYEGHKQHYGSAEGTDPAADPLLPLFREVFGPDANRFNHTWDEIEAELLPKAKEKIAEAFRSRDLTAVDFTVSLVPATLDNLEMTLRHPESSTTNTYEWTSTPLVDDKGTDTGRRLVVGLSDGGGAGRVGTDARSVRGDHLGARLAVVFKKRD